jgi:DNA-binding NarL/FixJ family response regulator
MCCRKKNQFGIKADFQWYRIEQTRVLAKSTMHCRAKRTVGCSLPKILIVDDHGPLRKHLRSLLESVESWKVVGEASNGRTAVHMHHTLRPDITLMDFHMPDIDGLKASRLILSDDPTAPILMLTVSASSALMHEAKLAGLKGFCPKSQIKCIVEAIESLLRGETYFPELAQSDEGSLAPRVDQLV